MAQLEKKKQNKNPPANAEDAGDVGLIPGSVRSLEKEMAICSSLLEWKIPWTEEPGKLFSMGRQDLDTTEHVHKS